MSLLSRLLKRISFEHGTTGFSSDYSPKDDDQMDWAIKKARLTLWYFEEQLKGPTPGRNYFSIKVMVKDQTQVEHLWLTAPDFDEEGNLYGKVCDEPILVKNLKAGQTIGVGRSLITDWMIVEDGLLLGGYTIRAVRDELSEIEKQAFDESIGIVIDAGADHFLPDFNTPEGAITALELAYQEKDLEKALACMDFEGKARRLLMHLNVGKIDEAAMEETSEILKAAFIEQLEEEGMPDISGLRRAFSRSQKISEVAWLITESITFPHGGVTEQIILTAKTSDGWKVGGLYKEDTTF
ncbi:DUF2314 domain-containing protein [Pedobacter sp. PLR]|uniref:YegJ family protein n=1 Tax=Pedobacter sp. PLR TaxID=2994465 RepID=UPI0022465F9C|nr:DUF2314 domain-containing protein [Pedobacter sp. PLR]MCX2453909.1 DUF2314 domain-containing protein [Pedobacter sp. PLR]